jgi:23S rRNA pseudouridine955/2504/2580 synthase
MPVLSIRKEPNTQTFSVRLVNVTEANEDQRLDNFLIALCKGVPKSRLYKAVRSGEVRVNRSRAQVDQRLSIGDVVRVPPMREAEPSAARYAPPHEFPIVFEDDALLVIDKPAGVAVHGGSGVSHGVIEQLRAARPGALFLELVHRLDRDTSGLLMIAKQRKALVRLHAMLREGGGDKHYLALVQGNVLNDRQHLKQSLAKWTTQSGERRVKVDSEGQVAHTVVTCLKRFGEYSLVDAELKTGRTHQIRVHLAHAGHPIVGDDKYGQDETQALFKSKWGFDRMFLHAARLSLTHPLTGEKLALEAALPNICERLLKSLSK